MRQFVTFAAAIAMATPLFVSPGISLAQSYDAPPDTYYQNDPCEAERHGNARAGTVLGGIVGAVVGSQVAGRGNRTAGAVIGGTVGATVGHQVGAHSLRCGDYPPGYRRHAKCRWISDTYEGRDYSYEICKGHDGYWRPYRGDGY